jgi:hypothetical protein
VANCWSEQPEPPLARTTLWEQAVLVKDESVCFRSGSRSLDSPQIKRPDAEIAKKYSWYWFCTSPVLALNVAEILCVLMWRGK